jgi:hypothetical protein
LTRRGETPPPSRIDDDDLQPARPPAVALAKRLSGQSDGTMVTPEAIGEVETLALGVYKKCELRPVLHGKALRLTANRSRFYRYAHRKPRKSVNGH